tara:strand:- start:18665 stop:19513 length:849 start_codon:yes stop_codon:yes gene_type:complete
MNITAIDPQYQRKNATAAFGMYGTGWGILPGSETYTIMDVGVDEKMCLYQGTFFYVTAQSKGSFPITSTIKVQYMTGKSSVGAGYMKVDDEFAKKAQTDALTKGLSFLGFNSDVFEGRYDDSRYMAERREEVAKEAFIAQVTEAIGKDDIALYQGYVNAGDGLALVAFMGSFATDDPKREAFFASWPKGTKSKMTVVHGNVLSAGHAAIIVIAACLASFIATDDEQGIVENWDDCAKVKKFIKPLLTDGELGYLKDRAARKVTDAVNEAEQEEAVEKSNEKT